LKLYSDRKKKHQISEEGFTLLKKRLAAEKSFSGNNKDKCIYKTGADLKSDIKRSSLTGFTLLEVLISAAIVSVLSVVMYAVFSSGVTTWKKAREMRFLEKNVFGSLRELTTDLRNCLKITTLPVTGGSDRISFPGLIKKNTEKELGLITYYFDEDSSSIIKSAETYAEALNEEESKEKGIGKALVGNIDRFSLSYCYLDTDTELYDWRDDWEPEDDSAEIPRAVKVLVELDRDGRKISVEKLILIPMGLSGRKGSFK